LKKETCKKQTNFVQPSRGG